MSFVRFNGWDVPIVRADRAADEIGERGMAIDGTMLTDRRALKGRWPMATKHVTEMVAEAIEGVLRGSGHNWNFDADLYSGKGLGPGSTVGSRRIGVAADGASVVDAAGAAEAKFGDYALTVEPACTNILSANQRDGGEDTTTTGFAAAGSAVISSSTEQRAEGSRSIKVVTSGAGDGVETDPTPCSAATEYSASVYVFCAAERDVVLGLDDDEGGSLGTVSVTVPAGKWTRLTITATTDPAATEMWLTLEDDEAGGTTLYVDMLQIEANGRATTWADPSRAAGDLEYSPAFLAGAADCTVNFWARLPAAIPANDVNLVVLGESGSLGTGNYLSIYRGSGQNEVKFETAGSGSEQVEYTTSPWDGDWHMVTCVFRSNPETGEVGKALYFDGALVASSTPSASEKPDLADADVLQLGHMDGAGRVGGESDGLLDDVLVLPYAAPAAQVAGWFAMGKAIPDLPEFYVDGDFDPRDALTVKATASPDIRSTYVRAQDGSVWRPNQRRLSFELRER